MLAGYTPMQVAAMQRGIARAMADPDVGADVPEGERCVNFGARAEDNGWCSGCWSLIDPRLA